MSKAMSGAQSHEDEHIADPEGCDVVARRHRNVNACVAQAMTVKKAASTPVADAGASLKERRAAARRRNMGRRQPPPQDMTPVLCDHDGGGEDEDESAALAWESKRQRSQSTRPRRNVGLSAIRSVRCGYEGFLYTNFFR